MGQFLNSINEVRKNYSKYDAWEQKQADERAQKEYLSSNLDIPKDKLELTQKRAETVVRATEIMDTRSEDNCENMEQLLSFASLPLVFLAFAQTPIAKFISKKFNLNFNKAMNYVSAGVIGATLLGTIGLILWGNSKQKEASRIGRYQAKQNELKDIKNFVVYTPEQLEKAKEIAKKIPDEKERNSISKMIKELKDVSKDKKTYKEWLAQKDPHEIEKLKAVNITPEQLQKAEEDKELIVDAVKEINIKAEEYSENVENAFDTFGNLSWLAAVPLGFGLNKLLKALNVDKKWKTITSVAVPILTTFGIQLTGTIEQKKASRVGRYKARQDLLKNPARLMAYSEEDMKKAENVRAPKQKQSFFEKLGGSFSFISKYYKDKSEYTKYKKTTQKENEKIQKAFKQIDITEAQKAEAKALQKNVFRAFDEIDEMSQRYSEDVEAGTEIAKQIGATAWTLGSMSTMVLLAVLVRKGKFPLVKLGNWLTNLTFDSKSSIKLAINNLNNVLKGAGKPKTKEFQEALVKGKIHDFLALPENKAIKDAITPLTEELKKIGINSAIQISSKTDSKNASKIISDLFQHHFKQTALARWMRNMLSQCTKLWVKNKASSAGFEISKELQQQAGMNFNYKNYKTLINTGLVAGIPVLGSMFAVLYAFNAWLTNIQKKAGKIGIMKAMEKIDDPRVFVQEYPNQEKTEVSQKSQSSNMLEKFKK